MNLIGYENNIKERQIRGEKRAKAGILEKSHSEALMATREERAISKYNEIMNIWRKDSERIASKLKRNIKDSVLAR